MEWIYQNKEYYTEPIEVNKGEYGETFGDFNTIKQWVDNYGLVWHRKWNKVYKLVNARDAGNGSTLKAWIDDVYTGKQYVCQLHDLELVREKV